MQQRRLAQFLMLLKIKLKTGGRGGMHKVLVSLGPWKRRVWERVGRAQILGSFTSPQAEAVNF